MLGEQDLNDQRSDSKKSAGNVMVLRAMALVLRNDWVVLHSEDRVVSCFG